MTSMIHFWLLQDHFSCLECGVSLRLVSGDGGEYAEDDSVFLEEDEENLDLEVANNNITSEKKRSTVYQKDGLLYCERDYKKLFVPRCSSCRGHIMKVSGPQEKKSLKTVRESNIAITLLSGLPKSLEQDVAP